MSNRHQPKPFVVPWDTGRTAGAYNPPGLSKLARNKQRIPIPPPRRKAERARAMGPVTDASAAHLAHNRSRVTHIPYRPNSG